MICLYVKYINYLRSIIQLCSNTYAIKAQNKQLVNTKITRKLSKNYVAPMSFTNNPYGLQTTNKQTITLRTLYPIPLHLYHHPYKILINPILPFISFICLHIYFSVFLSTFPNSQFTPTNSNLWKKNTGNLEK